MRICTKCKINEPRNKTSSYCNDCFNLYQNDYYKKNFNRIKETSSKRREKIRNFIINAKDIPCVDCGIKYPYYVMDFDHVRGEKKFNLSIAGNLIPNIKKVIEEIEKCDVVCSNCHRIRTFKRLAYSSTS